MSASSAHAIDRCKVKVDKRTGVILVSASGVAGPLAWGEASGQEVNSFFNSGTCVVADKAKGCQLGDPNTLASKTAPAGCTLYLDDGATPCSSWIPGCSPGARSDTTGGAVIKDSNDLALGVALSTNLAIREESGTALALYIQSDGSNFFLFGNLFFASNDCTGPGLMFADTSIAKNVMFRPGGTGYYAPATVTNQSVASTLYWSYADQAACDVNFGVANTTFVAPDGCCQAFAPTMQPVNPAQTVDLSAYVPPFTLAPQ